MLFRIETNPKFSASASHSTYRLRALFTRKFVLSLSLSARATILESTIRSILTVLVTVPMSRFVASLNSSIGRDIRLTTQAAIFGVSSLKSDVLFLVQEGCPYHA